MSYHNNLPTGIKLEHTSMSQNIKTSNYTKPQIFAQNPNSVAQKAKPRGGWDDEDDVATINSVQAAKTSFVIQTGNTTTSKQQSEKQDTVKKQENQECDEAFIQAHEYENKITSDIVQPNGARLKQPDSVLNEFCRACESLQVEVIGSFLYHHLKNSNIWTSKMKAIYAIEALVKKMDKYKEFYKFNLHFLKCKTFTEDGPNGPQLKKAFDDLIDFLEGNPSKTLPTPEKQKPAEVQKQSQPAKIDVFNMPSSSSTSMKLTSSPTSHSTFKSAGLPGAFKKQAKTATQPQSPSSISSQEETQYQNQNQNPNSQTNQPLNSKKSTSDSILDSLAGLDFSENSSNNTSPIHQGFNTGQYGGPNFSQSPTSSNQGGLFYPYPNQFNQSFPNQFHQQQQVYPQQFIGQHFANNSNMRPNYQMQDLRCQGQVPQYGGYYGMQYNNPSQQGSRSVEEKNYLSIAEMIQKQEQEKQQQEEIERKKKQQEIESKFDSLKYLL